MEIRKVKLKYRGMSNFCYSNIFFFVKKILIETASNFEVSNHFQVVSIASERLTDSDSGLRLGVGKFYALKLTSL